MLLWVCDARLQMRVICLWRGGAITADWNNR